MVDKGRVRLRYVSELDGLRAVAVILVVLYHVPSIDGFPSWIMVADGIQKLRTGFIGVDVFFVLSGFLITRIILKEKAKSGRIDYKEFYLRRALRIFPIYYATIAVCALLFGLSLPELVVHAAYLTNFGGFVPVAKPLAHTWSLAVEEQFYLVWPFFLSVLPGRRGLAATMWLIPGIAMLCAILIAIAAPGDDGGEYIYFLPFTRMMSLSFGAALAFHEQASGRISQRWSLAAAVGGIAWLLAEVAARSRGIIPPGAYYRAGALAGYAMTSVGLVATFVFAPGGIMAPISATLRSRPLRYLGRISYGLYLYHYPILFGFGVLVPSVGSDKAWAVVASLLVTVILAASSYRYVERPLLQLKRQVAVSGAITP